MDSLTNIEIYKLFKNHKQQFQAKPNFDAVADEVIDKLELSKSSKSKVIEDLENLFKEYKIIQKNNHKLHSTRRNIVEKIVIKKSSYSKFGKKLSLDEASPRTQRRRLHSFTSTTNEIAIKEGVTPPKLLAMGLKSHYLHDKNAANVGRKLVQQEAKVSNKVSMSTALAILIAGKMTKRMYIDIRLLLKNDGHDILPVYDKLNEYRKEKRPPLEKLQDPYKGI